MWLNLKRTFRSGFINFWRTPVVSLSFIITLTVTLFVIGGLMLASTFFAASLDELKSKVDISVSFKTDAPEGDILSLRQSLEALPEVRTVTYRSREEELADFRERNRDNELVIQSLEEVGNPFGARLNVQAVDPARYESIAAFLESEHVLSASGKTLIDQISFKKNVVDRLIGLIDASERLGLAAALVLVFISLVVAFNTISLAIYGSREEIGLMKLVGASNSYVRGPFLVQGIIAGVFAALLALALLYPSVIWVRNATASVYGGINLLNYFLVNFSRLAAVLILTGVFLGVAASFLAVRRHLNI